MIGVQSATSYEPVLGVSLNAIVLRWVATATVQKECRDAGRRYLQTACTTSGNADSYLYRQERSFAQNT